MALDSKEKEWLDKSLILSGLLVYVINASGEQRDYWDIKDLFNGITDQDLIAAGYDWLTANDLANLMTAFTTLATAMGDANSGQYGNLLKANNTATVRTFNI